MLSTMDCNKSSTSSDLIIDTNTVEESGRGCRNKRKQSYPIFCPVCSCTLRSTELDTHLVVELSKLCKLNWKAKCPARSTNSPSSVNGSTASEKDPVKCWETFQKVKSNRENRLKLKSRKRKNDQMVCPVCNQETTEDINLHVEMCLDKIGSSDVESDVDVEGDNNDRFEEYEWAGQSRVRASSLLDGGYAGMGLGTSISAAEDDNVDLVVDGDDNEMYGSPQYTERDIMLLDGENTALREAIIGDNCTKLTVEKKKEKQKEETKIEDGICKNSDPIFEALKNRIRELEKRELSKEVHKCLICMEKYQTPVISVCCWHVHCESCWLQTLAAKKLCPQCNMITSPSDLRRIYI